MYGTVAKMRAKHGHVGGLELVARGAEMPKGAVGLYVFRSDADPDELWMIAIFESKDAYFANARSPEQHERFLTLMNYLEKEPEWHDGEIVFARPE
jgi:quinol monooxygenase YgiN